MDRCLDLSRVGTGLVAALLLGLCACGGDDGGTAVDAPREVIVVKAGYVWVDGHWERHGNRWDWRPGYYERARADSDWVPGRWERRGRGHVWIAGTWRVRGGGRGHDNGHHRGDAHDQDHRHR
jgi:hypothetical protein